MCSRWFSVLLMVQFEVFQKLSRMADIMLKLKIDPKLSGVWFWLQVSMLTLCVIIAVFVISHNG